jgi:hypothetical protein
MSSDSYICLPAQSGTELTCEHAYVRLFAVRLLPSHSCQVHLRACTLRHAVPFLRVSMHVGKNRVPAMGCIDAICIVHLLTCMQCAGVWVNKCVESQE